MTTIGAASTLTDVAFAVCTALNECDVTGVLAGGSAATYYAPRAYQSRDLDFIITLAIPSDRKRAGAAILDLGYRLVNQTYVHKSNPFTVEFPPGPLAIGDDLIERWNTVRRRKEILHVITPTDCVRDRLLWFYLQPTDRSSLQAAIGVAKRQAIDLKAIETWSKRDGFDDKYREFAVGLGKSHA